MYRNSNFILSSEEVAESPPILTTSTPGPAWEVSPNMGLDGMDGIGLSTSSTLSAALPIVSATPASTTTSISRMPELTPAMTFAPDLTCICPMDSTPMQGGEGDSNDELFWLFASLMVPILIGFGHGFVSSAYERMIRNKLRDESNNETGEYSFLIFRCLAGNKSLSIKSNPCGRRWLHVTVILLLYLKTHANV